MKLTTQVRSYGTHNAITIKVNGKKVGWIQVERDNLAFYGTSAKNSMSEIIKFNNPRNVCGHNSWAQTTKGCIDCAKETRFV